MQVSVYDAEASAEYDHWWFVGRRKLFGRLLHDLHLPPDTAILDAGTSTGTNLRMLRDLGYQQVYGVDVSPEALRYCAAKGWGMVCQGDLRDLPYADESFSLVLGTDVIEHIDDDQQALSELYRVLVPGGHVLLTVPAFPSLWGIQDEVAQHKRRYRRSELLQKIKAAGFVCQETFYFNFLLFVPIWLARRIFSWWRPKVRSENDINTPLLNRLLTGIFLLDIHLARYVRAPFGVSIAVMCHKPTDARSRSETRTLRRAS